VKKEYDDLANRRNIPNLDLYTKLIGLSYISMGINMLIVYLSLIEETMEFKEGMLILSIVMFVMAPVAMTDPRKTMRNLFTVVITAIMLMVITIFCLVVFNCFWIILTFF